MNRYEHGFIIDCSAAMSLVFFDEQNQEVKKIETLLAKTKAQVPPIWHYEVANVLCMAEQSRRISEANVVEFKSILNALPIVTDTLALTKTIDNTFLLAKEHNLTIYDAAYLELAMRQGMPLATGDKKLKTACKRSGVLLV